MSSGSAQAERRPGPSPGLARPGLFGPWQAGWRTGTTGKLKVRTLVVEPELPGCQVKWATHCHKGVLLPTRQEWGYLGLLQLGDVRGESEETQEISDVSRGRRELVG